MHLYGINISSDMLLHRTKRPFTTDGETLPSGSPARLPPYATRVTATIGRHETQESLTSSKRQKQKRQNRTTYNAVTLVPFKTTRLCVFVFLFSFFSCPAFPVARGDYRNHGLMHVVCLSPLCRGFRLGLRLRLSSPASVTDEALP